MLLQMYSIRDAKSEAYHAPFMSHNVRDGMRRFHRILTEAEIFKGYEEDYSLYHIGSFDDMSGEVEAPENGKPVFVITALATLGKEVKEEKE
jgi:hypothetical protein